jgi:hypothetical protein
MTWILVLISTLTYQPNVHAEKIGVFPPQAACEQTRQSLQEHAEKGRTYLCVAWEKR